MELNLSGKQYRQLRAAISAAHYEASRNGGAVYADNLQALLDHLEDEHDRFNEAEAARAAAEKACGYPSLECPKCGY